MREETVTPELVDTEIRAVPLRQPSPGLGFTHWQLFSGLQIRWVIKLATVCVCGKVVLGAMGPPSAQPCCFLFFRIEVIYSYFQLFEPCNPFSSILDGDRFLHNPCTGDLLLRLARSIPTMQ